MDYLEKIEENPAKDLLWNIPEQKQGEINVVGGNLQNFLVPVKIAEFLNTKYPLKNVRLLLPDALKNKLPPLDNLIFLASTDSGSLADEEELKKSFSLVDSNLLIGDFSKNSITMKAVANACQSSDKPILITRDTIDLITEGQMDRILMNENLILMGSMAQMQKIFRSVYYPKMLLLSQSLVQVAEALHKFTLSYPVSLVTLHNEQILIAKNGTVKMVPIEKSGYLPITLWNGELAAKIVALNLYNPNNFLNATLVAIFEQ